MKGIRLFYVSWMSLLIASCLPAVVQAQWQATCNILPNYPVYVSLVSSSGNPLDSIESGKDFNLNITLPGMGNQNCSGYVVQIQTSNNLTLGTQPASTQYPFVQTSSNPPVFSNASPIPTTNGYGLNIPFHFLSGTTCNGELGTFKIVIKTTCGNTTDSCVLNVSLKAIAKNYWKVSKQKIWGNLSGGYVLWRIVIQNTNPNPGIGDLNIYSGSITDQITGSNIISSVSGASGVTGLGTSTASWNTGTISVYSTYVMYDVWTKMCDPAGTLVQNCVKYNFCLGKPVGKGGSLSTQRVAGGVALPQPIPLCCASDAGQACDTVTLVKEPNYGVCFGKSRPHASYINWAQGCEGFYEISACGNCGTNVPLDSLVIQDNFPAGIQVTDITVISPLSGTLQVGSSSYAFAGGSQTYPFTSPPSGFVFSTTPGQYLFNHCVTIRVKFKITAPAGTLIQNCAHLNYTNASFPDTFNKCGVPIPGGSYQGSATSCDTFTVRPAQAVPFIQKCIRNGQSSFNVGDVIPFQIVIINHGQAPLGPVNVQDLLGSPQNLQLVPGSIQYQHGMGAFNIYYPWTCSPIWSQPDNTQPSWVNYTGSGNQNLSWTINGMPGSCELDSAYYLVIQFDAVVLPQSFGNYTNTATLTGSGWNISSSVPYNVLRLARIDVSKKVGVNGQWGTTGFVNPGQNFQYQITLCNVGSVALKNLQVQDVLPSCVQLQNCSGYIQTASGQQPVTGISCTAPNFNFPASLTILPGECAVLVLNVKRHPQDTSAQCCNPLARGMGTTTDAVAQTIQDEDGPVCVKLSLCCALETLQVQLQNAGFSSTLANFNLHVVAGNLPIQELHISLLDYHVQYNYPDCKPPQMGNYLMHLSSPLTNLTGSSGGPLVLQNPNPPFVNHQLDWMLGSPTTLNAGVNIPFSLVFPSMLQIPCCTGRVYFCLLVEVKDVNCRICQKTVCGYFDIPAGKSQTTQGKALQILQDLRQQQKE